MILAVIGGTPEQHVDLYMQLCQAISNDYEVRHVKLSAHNGERGAVKIKQALLVKYGDTVTLITGVSSVKQIAAFSACRVPPVFCVMPGPLPPRLINAVEFKKDWLFVAPTPSELETPEKQRRYCTITEAFSECFARKREFFYQKGDLTVLDRRYVLGSVRMCARPDFWRFLAFETGTQIASIPEAAAVLRRVLRIQSRGELASSERAACEYRVLITRFNDHLRSVQRERTNAN